MQPENTGRILGYARVSTKGQDLDYQLRKLKAAGCVRIFREKRSGKSLNERPELEKLLHSLRENDLLLATATDRVARDPVDLLNVLHAVKLAGASMRLLDEPFIDTTSEMSDLIIFLVGWAARWQRKRILENTAHGRELARDRGVRFGRKPKLSPDQRKIAIQLKESRESCARIAQSLGVSQSTIYRLGAPEQPASGNLHSDLPGRCGPSRRRGGVKP